MFSQSDLKNMGIMNPKADQLFGGSLNPDDLSLYATGSSIGEVVLWSVGDF